MSLGNYLIALTLASFFMNTGVAQSASCRDAAEESHHRVLLESSGMRVFLLELPRIASTDSFCYRNPYVYLVVSEGRSSTTAEGQGTLVATGAGQKLSWFMSPKSR